MKGLLAWLLLACACRTYDTVYTDDAGGQCVKPRLPCNGVCIDPATDRENCGGCGNVCGPSELCIGSGCVPCPNGQIACGTSGAAFCADTQNNSENCGACGNACGHGTTCKNGQCGCPLTTCGSDCVDTSTDVSHCGSCDVSCPAPAPNETALCTKGTCSVTCVAPFADCDGSGANGCEANLQTSGANCGACGRACVSGTCTSGMCPVMPYTTGGLLGPIAVDGTSIYWADRNSGGGIDSAPVGGGVTTQLYPDTSVTVLGVDGALLVWLHLNDAVESRLISGGNATILANGAGIRAMAVAGGYAYWATAAGDVLRTADDGSGAPVTITTAPNASALAVDGANVYVATLTDVLAAPIGGQGVAPTVFAPGASPIALTLDATHVYWENAAGEIVRQAKASSTPTKIATAQPVATNLATDGVSIYWGTTTGDIERMPVSGGTPTTIAKSQAGTMRTVALDATRVYWASDVVVASTTK